MPPKKRKPRGIALYLPLLKRSVPFLLSVAIHLSIILIIAMSAKVILAPNKDPLRELPIIPQAMLADTNPGGALRSSNNTEDPLGNKLISPIATPSSPSKSTFILDHADPALPGVASTVGIPSDLGIQRNSGNEPTFGVGNASGVQAPRSQFLGLGGNATRIVYVFDASASMDGKLKFLTDEVKASIALLKPTQSFNVLFFQKESFLAADAKNLIPATDKNKSSVTESFLDPNRIRTAGATNPIPALQFAFDLNAQLIYLLTDGDFSGPGNPAVIQFCKEKCQNGRIKINTIAFTSPQADNTPNNPDESFIKTLQEIASQSGGQFRQVSNYSR